MAVDIIEVMNPSTGALIGTIAAGSAQAAEDHVNAAVKAASDWASTSPAERGAVLKDAALRLRDHAQEIAAMQSAEGENRSLTRWEA
jgi:acyl-CoA reductase-like NAD-dependent aldehyde dehydrogenase